MSNLGSQAFWYSLALGGVLTINGILALLVGYRRYSADRATFAPRWSLVDLWFGAQLTLACAILLLIPVHIVFFIPATHLTLEMLNPEGLKSLFTSRNGLLLYVLPCTILQNVAFWLVPAGFVRLKYHLRLRDIGLPRLPGKREVVMGVLLGLCAMLLSGGIEAGATAIARHFQHLAYFRDALAYMATNPVAQMTDGLRKTGLPGLILGVLAIGVSAPIGEETLFRGFAYNVLNRRFGAVVGVVGSALFFALLHSYSLIGLIPVFLLGIVFAWVYRSSGSLWVTILMHVTNNTLAFLLTYFQLGG